MEEKKRRIRYIAIALVLFIIVIILIFLLKRSETRFSDDTAKDEISALDCKTGPIEDGFFVSETANSTSNELKITFKNQKMDKIYYSYYGVYRSEDVANADDTHLHAKYNIYMGENGVEQGSLNPNYSVVKTKYHISLYVDDYDKINPVTAKFFFIDKEDIEEFNSYPIDTLKSYYEKKNFKCEVIKNQKEVDEK